MNTRAKLPSDAAKALDKAKAKGNEKATDVVEDIKQYGEFMLQRASAALAAGKHEEAQIWHDRASHAMHRGVLLVRPGIEMNDHNLASDRKWRDLLIRASRAGRVRDHVII